MYSGPHGTTLPCLLSISAQFINQKSQGTEKLVNGQILQSISGTPYLTGWTLAHPNSSHQLLQWFGRFKSWFIPLTYFLQAQDTYKFSWRVMVAMIISSKTLDERLWRRVVYSGFPWSWWTQLYLDRLLLIRGQMSMQSSAPTLVAFNTIFSTV